MSPSLEGELVCFLLQSPYSCTPSGLSMHEPINLTCSLLFQHSSSTLVCPLNPYSNSLHYKQNLFRLPTTHRSFAQFEANQCLYQLIFFIFCTWSLPLPLIAAFILVFSVSQQRQEFISAIDKSILISPLLSERRKYVIT
jgi:hypothetical protein